MPDLRQVIQTFSTELLHSNKMSFHHHKVLKDLAACRTPLLGGHANTCEECGSISIAYNSCRNRHCPLCQNFQREKWQLDRMADLLNTQYFHLVFTVPDCLNPIIYRNKKTIYNLLFSASSKALQQIAANPKHLGAQLGFTGILHTWGQTLSFHPHIHYIVPGGGWISQTGRYKHSKKKYLFPVKLISRVFRGIFLNELRLLISDNRILHHDTNKPVLLNQIQPLLNHLYQTDFIVFSKANLASPFHVLRYLCQYTHRVAISNHRIVSISNTHVTFKYKDYADLSKTKLMTLTGIEFLRRFLMHVLPSGFVKIRHFGFLASRNRSSKLAAIQKNMNLVASRRSCDYTSDTLLKRFFGDSILKCKHCQTKIMPFQNTMQPQRC